MSLARPSLSIGQNGGIIPWEASKDQVASTHIKNLLLRGVMIEYSVELELLGSYLEQLVILLRLYALPAGILSQFSTD